METPKNFEEILKIEDIEEKISYLKKGRRTPLPDTVQNFKDWNPKFHAINDESKYPKVKVLISKEEKKGYEDANGEWHTTTEPAKVELKDPNRIALPIEQDIVNIQTSFAVGTEPTLECNPKDDAESGLLMAVKKTLSRNKMKFQNRKEVRAWLAEQDVAEYWYTVKDNSFWSKIKKAMASIFNLNVMPDTHLRCQIWSPFLGDTIYPFYDENGDYKACSREYKIKDYDGNEVIHFMCVTETNVYVWKQGTSGWEIVPEKTFEHKLPSVPVMYAYNKETYAAKIRPQRERLEKCLSGYADCIDYHFFPKLLLFGELQNMFGTDARNQMLQLENGAEARYLTWNQAADPIKVEIETYFNQIYALTNTPRISFDQLKGVGNALSGTAFRYFFMAAHMAVRNHEEVLGEFFQRRINFLVSALGSLSVSFKEASQTIDIETELVPYIIDSIDDKVNTAAKAVGGGVWSLEHGVAYCSEFGETKDEVEKIIDEQKDTASNKA